MLSIYKTDSTTRQPQETDTIEPGCWVKLTGMNSRASVLDSESDIEARGGN